MIKTNSIMGVKRKSTASEHKAVIQEMKNFGVQSKDKREVGIFWYDTEKNELFGIEKIPVTDLKRNQSTIQKLHYQYWRDQKYKRNHDPRIKGKYEDVPRGRLIITKDDKIQVYIGSWYKPYIQKLQSLIKKEFNLTDFDFIEDEHWNIGRGPSGDLLSGW